MASATPSAAAVAVWVGWVGFCVGWVVLEGSDDPPELVDEPDGPEVLDEELVDDGVPFVDDPVAPVVDETVPVESVGDVWVGVDGLPAAGATQAPSTAPAIVV